MRFKTYYLNEEIIQGGRLVTFYHRTGHDVSSYDNVKDINNVSFLKKLKELGLKAGNGAMYGKGIYGTYTLDAQLTPNMKGYGPVIVKMKTTIDKVIIFDYDVAKKIYGKNYTLVDQFKKFKIKIDSPILDSISKELKTTKYTSDQALEISHQSNIMKRVNGLLFTGRQDSEVLVMFNEKIVVPMSINTTFKNPQKLDYKNWIDIKNKDIINRALDISTGEIDSKREKKMILFNNVLKRKNMDLVNDIDTVNPEFMDNFKYGKNLVVYIDRPKNVVITDGVLSCENLSDNISIEGYATVTCKTATNVFVKLYSKLVCINCDNVNVFDNSEVECDTWKNGSVFDNATVICNTWKTGNVFNGKVYIKGKLAKIENYEVVQ